MTGNAPAARRIAILKAGGPPAELDKAPAYEEMIRAAIGPRYRWQVWDATAGELPDSRAADAFVITGSAASTYAPDPWVAALAGWIRALDPAAPLIGICFGHQLIAQALGGRVEKSARGWGLGIHRYAITLRPRWIEGENSFAIPVSHYDQVVRPPEAADTIASNAFCPHAAFAYRDRAAISFQGHPEFPQAYVRALIDLRAARGLIDESCAAQARASLTGHDDRGRVLGWIRCFLDGSIA